jgi:hypothetical protein
MPWQIHCHDAVSMASEISGRHHPNRMVHARAVDKKDRRSVFCRVAAAVTETHIFAI